MKLPASVKVKDCSIEDASALFVGAHAPDRGQRAHVAALRLLEKGASGFHVLKAPGLGRWRKSKPAVGDVRLQPSRARARGGSLYRAEVDFRWYDDDGAVVGTARRRSAPAASTTCCPT